MALCFSDQDNPDNTSKAKTTPTTFTEKIRAYWNLGLDMMRFLGILCSSALMMALLACDPGIFSSSSWKQRQIHQAIVGGKEDTTHAGVGALLVNHRLFCSGTLIAPRLVLTAGHCLETVKQYGASKILFRVDIPVGTGSQSDEYEILQYLFYPKYARTAQGLTHDLGVLVLKDEVLKITPMSISSIPLNNTWVGQKLLFLGYGTIQTVPTRVSPNKRYATEMTITSVQTDRVEAQEKGKSICTGDSGGPALYSINNRWSVMAVHSYLTGISTSAGPLCNGATWSFRVDVYASWILPLIYKYGGRCQQDSDCGSCYRCDPQKASCILKGSTPTSQYCKPCRSSADCGGNGKEICQKQTQGFRCLQACDANQCCPLGSTCQTINNQPTCIPDDDTCPAVSCTNDTMCGLGESCQNNTCQPKPVQPTATLCKKCVTDGDCAGGLCFSYPDGRYCTQPCVAELFCPTGYQCKTVRNTSQCISTTGDCVCSADNDCYTTWVCQDKLCQRPGGGQHGDSCSGQRICASRFQCQQTEPLGKICVQTCVGDFAAGAKGSVCKLGGQCNKDSGCYRVSNQNVCLQPCTTEDSCLGGGTCRPSTPQLSLCYCTKDDDCKRGFICNKSVLGTWGQCEIPAAEGVRCDDGYSCENKEDGTSLCMAPPTQNVGQRCDSIVRCKTGLLCSRTHSGESVCVRPCRTDTDCRSQEGGNCIISGSVRFCACDNSPCSNGYRCHSVSASQNICILGSCRQDADCGAGTQCQAGTCIKSLSPCQRDDDCSTEELCRDGFCATKPGCTGQTDCSPLETCQEGRCVKTGCTDDPDCLSHEICNDGTCQTKRTCFSNKDCEANERCSSGVCRIDPNAVSGTEKIIVPTESSRLDGGTPPETNHERAELSENPENPTPWACGCQTVTPSSRAWFPFLLCLLLAGFLCTSHLRTRRPS